MKGVIMKKLLTLSLYTFAAMFLILQLQTKFYPGDISVPLLFYLTAI